MIGYKFHVLMLIHFYTLPTFNSKVQLKISLTIPRKKTLKVVIAFTKNDQNFVEKTIIC